MPAQSPPPIDDPPSCDGIGHAWFLLPGTWQEQYAVARCCGVRAVSRFGEPWELVEEDEPPASAD